MSKPLKVKEDICINKEILFSSLSHLWIIQSSSQVKQLFRTCVKHTSLITSLLVHSSWQMPLVYTNLFKIDCEKKKAFYQAQRRSCNHGNQVLSTNS